MKNHSTPEKCMNQSDGYDGYDGYDEWWMCWKTTGRKNGLNEWNNVKNHTQPAGGIDLPTQALSSICIFTRGHLATPKMSMRETALHRQGDLTLESREWVCPLEDFLLIEGYAKQAILQRVQTYPVPCTGCQWTMPSSGSITTLYSLYGSLWNKIL